MVDNIQHMETFDDIEDHALCELSIESICVRAKMDSAGEGEEFKSFITNDRAEITSNDVGRYAESVYVDVPISALELTSIYLNEAGQAEAHVKNSIFSFYKSKYRT